ncbi:putative orfan [Tupanvirus soda lake]|uniref:Orfan n=2 Tax=Tupanvirus TaxID=2094720 RepID=A0AC62AAP7_9VIRU|nr:putative orfan [Tupanvirus soda lake]QKU34809.1 putative orfan [Tupanvirus soda lake]
MGSTPIDASVKIIIKLMIILKLDSMSAINLQYIFWKKEKDKKFKITIIAIIILK